MMWGVSFHQPWASAIAAGLKTWETRGRRAPLHHVGTRIFIHAALKRPPDGLIVAGDWRYCRAREPWGADAVNDDWLEHHACGLPGAPADVACPRGVIVATAVLAEALPMVQHRPFHGRRAVVVSPDTAPYVHTSWNEPRLTLAHEAPWGHWAPGRFAWHLTDAESLSEPVRVSGRQGWFHVPAGTLR